MSLWHVKSSYILSKFINKDGSVDCYLEQVQYYFTHIIDLPDGLAKHYLAHVRWYKAASSSNTRYYFSDNEGTCNVELWKNEFYPESHDCIIPIYYILNRFVLITYQTSNRQNTKEYLIINPINRKFHL